MKTLFASLVALSAIDHCAGQLPMLAGYQPMTKVVDEAGLDMDQSAMEEQLDKLDFQHARKVYEYGGNSYSVAKLTLKSVDPHPNPWPVGTVVQGRSNHGTDVRGILREEVSWDTTGDVHVQVPYETSEDPVDYVECRVGGLYSFFEADGRGCFNETGVVTFQEPGSAFLISYDYSYSVSRDNINLRTLSGLSSYVEENDDRFQEYDLFVEYFGVSDYGDHLIAAAFDEKSTEYRSTNVDPSLFQYDSSRAVMIKRATVIMNVWMQVAQKMEDAKVECDECKLNGVGPNQCPALNSWDSAVAYYVGSLEGEDGSGQGKFLWSLADRMCALFKTCGTEGMDESGLAWVNTRSKRLFEIGRDAVLRGRCDELTAFHDRVIPVMIVPLIQGTLKAAYGRAHHGKSNSDEEVENNVAESVVFANSLLPFVDDCNSKDAQTIATQLAATHSKVDFKAVKNAFENNYECLGVTCNEVGGIWGNGEYNTGASPCGELHVEEKSGKRGGKIAGALFITMFVLVLAGVFYWKRKGQSKTSRPAGTMRPKIGSVMA